MRLFRHIRPTFRLFLLAVSVMFIGIVTFMHIEDFSRISRLSIAHEVSELSDLVYSYVRGSTSGFRKQKYEEISKRFEDRRVAVRDFCEDLPQHSAQKSEINEVKTNLKYVAGSDIVYCAIEKTGSTFWKRILHVAGGWGNSSNPMEIMSKHADTKHGGFQTLYNSTWSNVEDIFNISTSIMFVRSPFTRMFSGWLDKFYSTNPYYWNSIGKQIIKLERPNATENSLRCGHDVTFPEFVSYIVRRLTSGGWVDGHFSANYKHCMPCNLTFDYIGKYESLKEDTYYLINKLNLSDKIIFTDFERDSIEDVIRDSSDWVFEKKPEVVNCMSFRCGLFRVWKRLQSRGIISKNIDFPYSSNEEANITTVEEFKAKIKNAHDISDPIESKQNRQEMLAMAFRSLSSATYKRLLEAFWVDFEMFGYDREPEFVNITHFDGNEYLQVCPFD